MKHGARHRLDPSRIVKTAEKLARVIGDRLPESNLHELAVELVHIAHSTEVRAMHARQPIYVVRAASLLAIVASILLLGFLIAHVKARWVFSSIAEMFQATDAGFNLMTLLVGALWFFASFEARIKRRRTLVSIEELREFIHVVDLAQLYYTPDLDMPVLVAPRLTLELDGTYLLMCTQMLAVIGNLASLYSRGAADDSILRAVFEVELLANAITAKLHSKMESARAFVGPG
jgi:hypothetical protein